MIPIYKSFHLTCLSASAKFYSYLMLFRHGIKYVLQLLKKENSVHFRMSRIKKEDANGILIKMISITFKGITYSFANNVLKFLAILTQKQNLLRVSVLLIFNSRK